MVQGVAVFTAAAVVLLAALSHFGTPARPSVLEEDLLQRGGVDQGDDVWTATSALGPSSVGQAGGPRSSDLGEEESYPIAGPNDALQPDDDGDRGRSIGDQEAAETYIDKHIYPPWPLDPEKARNTVHEDDISESELAARLSRAIDRHEKCRRHWPHLERLETAQEIRVRDARNNLEVANRGIERARKELIDAENLVMAARQVRHCAPVVVSPICPSADSRVHVAGTRSIRAKEERLRDPEAAVPGRAFVCQ